MAQEATAARTIVVRDWRDHGSATFRNVQLVSPYANAAEIHVYCGEIKSSNAVGGFVPFAILAPIDESSRVYFADPNDPGGLLGYKTYCKGRSGVTVKF
jgi:hypothetical protein